VRRALPLLAVLALWPASAGAQSGPTLTLKAPKATAYLHEIDFVGRMSPAIRNARVHLYRGSTLVTSGIVHGDGSYVLKVHVANPGPFQVRWLHSRSNPVTVRIVPRLDARFAGSRVAGTPLKLTATLAPTQAGRVRVQVIRSGRIGFDQSFAGGARVALGTQEFGPIRVRLTTVPRRGYSTVSRELSTTVLPPSLSEGMTSPAVAVLAHRLAALHYAVPSFSPTFSYDFVESVWAFQKVQGLDRTGAVDTRFWTRLENPKVPEAHYSEPANHIEVDKTRQVLYIVRDGKIVLISPTATAGIAGYYTPEGRFAIYRKVTGWDHSPLGVLWNPMYFVGGYAIHGGDPVPPYPASHGCVRVPDFVISRLFYSEPYGEVVYVYSS
jgi:lipoprotein-anchoring transpeptidase ErfK/SrfK